MLIYKDGIIKEEDIRFPEVSEVAWLYLDSAKEEEVKYALGHVFGCHPLVIEDALHFGQRPKLNHYPGPHTDHAALSLYILRSDFTNEEFCIVMSERFVITVTKSSITEIQGVYETAKKYPETMESPGKLVYHLLDRCIDEYFTVTDKLEETIDELEQQVFNHPEVNAGKLIFQLKRHVHTIRRLVSDGRNVVGMLSHESFPYTDSQHAIYFIDVYDHISRVVDTLDAARDNLSGLLDLQTAQRGNRMNEVMKTLTIISTIFLPLSFIVGLYGMNVKGIPEYTWPFGYAYVWALMLTATVIFVVYLKKKKWL